MRLREKQLYRSFKSHIFCIKIFFLLYIEGNGGNRWTSLEPSNVNEEVLLLELTQPIIFFPSNVPRQYVLNTSKQFLNHFNPKYEMFWETFCNSEMVTKKFLSTKEAIKGTHTHTHIHSRNCPLHHPETLHQESKHNHVQGKGALKLESHFQQHHH